MKKATCDLLISLIILVAVVSSADGSGFLLIEHGSKSMGMAGAFTGVADDPSTIFNNPAGIARLSGTYLSVGNVFVRNDQDYEVASELMPGVSYAEEIEHRTFFVPHFYVTQQVNERTVLGLGFYAPFGIGTNWADSAVGNSTANETHVKSYDFNPNIAFQVSQKLAVALGVHYLRFKTQIIRQIGLPGFTPVASYETSVLLGVGPEQLGKLKLDGRGGNWGYNLAVLYDVSEHWKAGFHYRSNMDIDISRSESTVDFVPSALSGLPPARSHSRGKTEIGLPGIFFAGISTTAVPRWNFALDVQYTTWNHFDDIRIQVEPDLVIGPLTLSELPALEEDWKNTFSFHFGAEHNLTDQLALRAGYFYDKTPIPDRTLGAILPGSDRHNFSVGCGYKLGDWAIDAAYLWSKFEDRSTRTNYEGFNASYESNFHLLGLTVTKRL